MRRSKTEGLNKPRTEQAERRRVNMRKDYDLTKISEMVFESLEPVDLWAQSEKPSYMLTPAELAGMPESPGKQIERLRVRLAGYFAEKFDCNYSTLQIECDLKPDTFQKVLRFRNGRNVTYPFLAKFCVGAGLTVEEAEELFLLMGHQLTEKNLSDYILMCVLSKHDDIMEYDADMRAQGLKGILSDDGKNDVDE